MIAAGEALALDVVRLNETEEERFRALEASIDAAVYERFAGGPFGFEVPHERGSAKVVVAVKRAYEAASVVDGWRWSVMISQTEGGHLLVFSPERVYGGEVETKHTKVTAYRTGTSAKPRACLVSDERGWAFDRNARDLAAYVEGFDFEQFYIGDWMKGTRPDWRSFDVVYELYHRNPAMGIPADRRLSSLRSQWFRSERPGALADEDFALLHEFRAFHVNTKREFEQIRDGYAKWCVEKKVVSRCAVSYLTNPVDHKRFAQTPSREGVVAEWNGSAGHLAAEGRFIKHFYDVVVPACERTHVPLVVAEASTKVGSYRRRSFEEMPEFYRQANVALCASEVEGASNSVMEAMASGLALIATDVGNHREMRDSELEHLGDSGIVLVEGTVGAFTDALGALTPQRAREMGEINRAEIAARWSWDAWKDRYADFLRMGL